MKVENDEDKERCKREGMGSIKKKKKGKVLRHLLRPIFTLRLQLKHAFASSPITNNIFFIILSLPITLLIHHLFLPLIFFFWVHSTFSNKWVKSLLIHLPPSLHGGICNLVITSRDLNDLQWSLSSAFHLHGYSMTANHSALDSRFFHCLFSSSPKLTKKFPFSL